MGREAPERGWPKHAGCTQRLHLRCQRRLTGELPGCYLPGSLKLEIPGFRLGLTGHQGARAAPREQLEFRYERQEDLTPTLCDHCPDWFAPLLLKLGVGLPGVTDLAALIALDRREFCPAAFFIYTAIQINHEL